MEIIKGLENIRGVQESIVTLGTFDGFHVGHRKLIDRVLVEAGKQNRESVLVTFEPHPQLVLKNKKQEIRLLTSIDEKLGLLNSCLIDKAVIIEFNKEFSQKSYRDFVKKILIDKIKMKHLIVGYDSHFGKNRKGNIETLNELASELDFKVSKVEPYYHNEQIISSSLIRNLILEGKLQEASSYLGRNYSLSGSVIPGDGRGKKLSFPTANIKPDNEHKLIPLDGVYAVDVNVINENFKGMLNIGNRPTFSTNHAIEVNVFGLQEDVYNKKITIHFKKRLRKEKKFSSREELVNQLKIDKEESLKY